MVRPTRRVRRPRRTRRVRRARPGLKKQVLQVVRRVATKKYINRPVNTQTWYDATVAAGNSITLPNMGLGTNENQRIGDSINLQRVSFRGYLLINQTLNVNAAGFVRVMVVNDRANDYTNTAFLEQTLTELAPLSQVLYQSRNRVKILYDKVYKWDLKSNSLPTSGSRHQLYNLSFDLDLKNILVNFEPSSLTINRNNIKLIFLGDNVTPSADITVYGTARVMYTDL